MRIATHRKHCFVTCLIIGILLIIVYSFSSIGKNISFFMVKDEPTKYILYWTQMFGDRGFYLGIGNNMFANCTYKNCYATDNRSLIPIEEFSAILFHGPEFSMEIHGVPQKRSPHQIYIYSNQESPIHTPFFTMTSSYNDFYNWTMTYRADSDVIRAYGYVRPQKTNYHLPSVEEIRKKKRRIAWFVSNCMTSSRRDQLARAISKYYPVDIYGSCGNLTCPKRDHLYCYNMVESDYTYFFSAENSVCTDYVTEKVYYVMKKNVIPIAYGGANYEKLTPPHSLIDVRNFKTTEELVNYLKFLDENIDEYLKYFEWKKNYVIDTTSEMCLCSLCEKLHKSIEPKSYSNMHHWWSGEAMSMCKISKQLPEIVNSVVTS